MIEKIKNSLPTKEQIKAVYPSLKENDLELLLHISQKTGLDILQKQIYAVPRGNSTTMQTSIDGFRLIAERTGNYAPGKESTFEYDNKNNLVKATSYIKKRTDDGTWHEVAVSAFMSEYNASSPFWKRMPHVMLAKCAEAQALRRAFPDTFSGLYTKEEMDQAEVETKEEKIEKMEEQINFDDQFIDEEKLSEIKEKILSFPEEKQIEMEETILEWYKIKDLNEITNKNYKAVINSLNKAKINKGKK